MIGNALGDGKPKDNTTDPKSETFAEKYKRELKKDLDDLGLDEEGDDYNENLELKDEDFIDHDEDLLDKLMGDDDDEVDLLD